MSNPAARSIGPCVLGLAILGATAEVKAQDVREVKLEFAKPDEVKKGVEWKASATAGVTVAAGNSNVVNISGGAQASRNDGKNKVGLELNGVYATTTTQALKPGKTSAMSADDVQSSRDTTAGFFLGKLRYDRFFTKRNSVYLAAFGGLDLLAGKKATAGAQLGYAREIVKTKAHDLSGEAGVDYGYTAYVQPDGVPMPMSTPFSDSVHLASGRLFLGYLLTLTENTSVNASFEALINFNPAAIGDRVNYDDPAYAGKINPFTGLPGGDARAGFAQATRWNAKVGLTTKIWKTISFRAAETLRYDNSPALGKVPFTAPAGLMPPIVSEDRYYQKLDSLTEVNLVVNFL